jgi:uncharacterized membrane protein YdjX (TVP38/TMEM64 family)
MAAGLKWVAAVAAVAALGAALFLLPLDRWLLALVETMRGAGLAGALLYVGAYVAACVLFLPGSILTLAAGFAYGPVQGTLLVMVASMLGATLAFVLGRTVLRGRIERRLAAHPRFAAVDRAVAAQGFKVVLLLRLSPLFPFNVLNYALGLTRVPLRTYALASLIGMFPGTLLYVYLGSLVTSAAQLASGQRPQGGGPYATLLFWGGLVATVLATLLITRTARRALAQTLEASGGGPQGLAAPVKESA